MMFVLYERKFVTSYFHGVSVDSSRDRFDEFRTRSIVSAATSYYRGKVNPLSKLVEIINVLH